MYLKEIFMNNDMVPIELQVQQDGLGNVNKHI